MNKTKMSQIPCLCGRTASVLCENKQCKKCCDNKKCSNRKHRNKDKIKIYKYNSLEIKEITTMFLDCIETLPEDIAKLIVNDYIDDRDQCLQCNKKHDKKITCIICDNFWCEYCEPDNIQIIDDNHVCLSCSKTNITKCKKCNGKFLLEFYSDIFKCDGCSNIYCYNCESPYSNDIPCHVEDCYYCSRGHCFNNRSEDERYCEKCFPRFDDRIKCIICDSFQEETDVFHYECDNCDLCFCEECSECHFDKEDNRYCDECFLYKKE